MGPRLPRKTKSRGENHPAPLHRGQQRIQIFIIIDTIRHVQIHIRGRFVRGIVVFLMDEIVKTEGSLRKIAAVPFP